MRISIRVLIASATLACSAAIAQSGQIDQPSLGSAVAEVQINNPNNIALSFQIGGNTCTGPTSQTLNPDHYGTYTCPGAASFSFVIATNVDGRTQTRRTRLNPSSRYEIFQEPVSRAWNIRQISGR